MNTFNAATKIASALGLASVAIEGHDMAKRTARRSGAKASTDKFLRDEIGASKLNHESIKHSASKDFFADGNVTDKFHEVFGTIGGYISGFAKCAWNNIFTIAFGAVGLIAKSKPVKTTALLGMGLSILVDTLFNGTSLFERKDYLDK